MTITIKVEDVVLNTNLVASEEKRLLLSQIELANFDLLGETINGMIRRVNRKKELIAHDHGQAGANA